MTNDLRFRPADAPALAEQRAELHLELGRLVDAEDRAELVGILEMLAVVDRALGALDHIRAGQAATGQAYSQGFHDGLRSANQPATVKRVTRDEDGLISIVREGREP